MSHTKLNNWVYCGGKIYGELPNHRIVVTPHVQATEVTPNGILAHTKDQTFLLGDCRESASSIVVIPEKAPFPYKVVTTPVLEEAA